MAIQRYMARRRIRRFRRKLRERIVLGLILGIFILNFCLCFGVGMVTSALQDIGILPDNAPTQPLPPAPEDIQVQESEFFKLGELVWTETSAKK